MTGWSRATIAAFGFVVLVVIVFATVAVAGLTSLCNLSDNATCPSAPPSVVLLVVPVTAVAGYAVTVWRAQLTPLLLSAIAVIPEAILIRLIWD